MSKLEKEIKNIFNQYKKSKNEKKKEIFQNLISKIENCPIGILENLLPNLKSIKDIDLNVKIFQIYEEHKLKDIDNCFSNDSNKKIDFEEYTNKLYELYNNAILCTSQKKVKKKYININIDRANTLINELLTYTNIEKIPKIKKQLVEIENNLIKIEASKEEIDFISSLKNTCDNYFQYIGAQILFEKNEYQNCLDILKVIKNDRDTFPIEQLEKNCNICLGKIYEEKGELEKAKEYYSHIKNNEAEIIRIEMLLLKKKCLEAEENQDYNSIINYFIDMYNLKNNPKAHFTTEDYYLSVLELFYKNLSFLVIKTLQENEENSYFFINQKLNEICQKINDKIIKRNINDLLNLFNKIKCKDNKEIYKIIENSLDNELTDMAQRIYIEILINSLMSDKEKNNHLYIINLIIKYINFNFYLSNNNLDKLRNIFKENKKELLVKLSELFMIIIKKGLEYSKEIIIIIGNIIIQLLKQKNKKSLEYTKEEYNLIIKQLFWSFESLIKEKDYELTGVVKIYETITQQEKNNKELITVFFKGFIYLTKKNYTIGIKILELILNYADKNEGNDELIELILEQIKITKDPKCFNLIPKLLNIIIENYQNEEENFFNTLSSLNLPSEFYSKNEFILCIENYFNKKSYYNNSIYNCIKKIPLSERTSLMQEKYKIFDNLQIIKTNKENEQSSGLNQINFIFKIQKKDFINKIVLDFHKKKIEEYKKYIDSGIKIELNQLKNIENNLEINGVVEILYKILLQQQNLISALNLEKICNFFSKESYKLFILMIENNINFNSLNLKNIVKNLGKDDEEEYKLIYQFFENLKKKQKIPKIIDDILNIYKDIQKYENNSKYSEESILKEIDDYYKLPLIPKKAEHLFSVYLNNYFESQKDLIINEKIISKIIKLISKNGIDIGENNFQVCLKNIKEEKFIDNFNILITSKRVAKKYKNILFDYFMTKLLNSQEENQLKLLKEIKYFSEFVDIPEQLLTFLTYKLENVDNEDIFKDSSIKSKIFREILLIIGNIFSIHENPKISKLIEVYNEFNLYNYIKNKTSKLNLKSEEVFYFYSIYIYKNEYNKENKELDLKLPRDYLVQNIISLINEEEKKISFINDLNYFEKFHQFYDFSPIREHFLRKLIFNKKIKPEKYGQNLVISCTEDKKIWKFKGEKFGGKKFGNGTIYYTNGDIYYGYFLNDLKNSEGIFVSKEYPKGIRQVWKEGILLK